MSKMSDEYLDNYNFESDTDRYKLMRFNCLYYNCNTENTWSINGSKLVFNYEREEKEFAYHLKANCCRRFKSGLWVSEHDLKDHNLQVLIYDFNNNQNIFSSSSKHSIDVDSIEYCDRIIKEMFEKI